MFFLFLLFFFLFFFFLLVLLMHLLMLHLFLFLLVSASSSSSSSCYFSILCLFFFLFLFFFFFFFFFFFCFCLLFLLFFFFLLLLLLLFLLVHRFKRGEFGPLLFLAENGCGMVWGVEILENKGFRDSTPLGARTRSAGSRNFCDPKNCKRREKTGREFWPHYLPPWFAILGRLFLHKFWKRQKKN